MDGVPELGAFYATEYEAPCGEFATGPPSLLSNLLDWNFRRIASRIESLVPRGRVLDVGCGAGVFLAAMERRGWKVAGVEPSVALAEGLRSHRGLTVSTGTLQDLPIDWGPFDADDAEMGDGQIAAWAAERLLARKEAQERGKKKQKELLRRKGWRALLN
jgi:SAM-dependent methyltransferase